MKLSEYRRSAGLSQARFAERMTAAGFAATQALVSQWESGVVSLTAERCVQIEQVTEGLVTRAELRPDLFGELTTEESPGLHRPGAAAEGSDAAQPSDDLSEAA